MPYFEVPESLAVFLRDEVSVRYATRIKVLEETVRQWRSVRELAVVRKLYADSFKELRDATTTDENAFREVIVGIRKRHVDVVRLLVSGMSTLRRTNAMEISDIDRFLDTFFASRIGTEILTSHYIMMTDPAGNNSGGIVSCEFDPAATIQNVVRKATMLSNRILRKAPKVEVQVVGLERVTLVFVQQYFSYIIFELLKNSFRATVEAHGHIQAELPPVKITVSCDENMVGVKVRDRGGGVPMKNLESIWSYTFTTAKKPEAGLVSVGPDSSPLAGFGCGLPLSLQYASYLGGGLDVVSIPGEGTIAYLVMNKPGDAAELVPASMRLNSTLNARAGSRARDEQTDIWPPIDPNVPNIDFQWPAYPLPTPPERVASTPGD